MQHARLSAENRSENGRHVNALRAEAKVPAILYGFGVEPTKIVVDRNAFNKIYAQAGASTVIDLELGGKSHPVLIADIQRDVLTDFFSHADFRRVDLTKTIEASIQLSLVGDAPAVKTLGGTLIQSLEEVEVESLPDALVHEIQVDISKLTTFDDVIRVSDIVIPAGITILTDLDAAIASVQPPRSEEEMAALDSAVDADISKVEVLTEKKEDAAEGADAAKKSE
ncbi:50S ribosomal protein L25 [Patescibacteria group bacterium]|nr:50S ribosomal protein L25 [Patescibacteria group bacterium]